jgi:GT2 family glycosyltransferase
MEPASLAASVVVPTQRGAHRLPALLEALAAQDTPEPWEVVVVVDGPDAETEAVLRTYLAVLPLRVIVRENSTGVAAALNTGYVAAQGRVLIRCDDDLTPAPDMVARHLAHHRGGDRVGVIGPTRDAFTDTPYARLYGRPANARALAAAYARPESMRWQGWAAHNSITRASFDAAGGFDESYSYREDSDLGLRLMQHGVRMVVDPALEIEHRGPAPDTSTRAARAWVSGASEALFATRHPGALQPPPGGAPSARARVWFAATLVVAMGVRGRGSAARAGALVDLLLPRVSPWTGGRLVALVVEGAARSGRRHGLADQAAYRAQKDAELAAERRTQK